MKEKYKIVQVIPDLGLGGAEIMVEALCNELRTFGHEVHVVSLYTVYTPITERLEQSGICVHYLNKNKGFDFSLILKLRKLIKKVNPEIIHTHLYSLPYSMLATLFLRISKRVHTIHNLANKEVSKNKRLINSIFYKYFSVIPVAISPLVKKSIIEEYNISSQKVPIVYNGIDLSKCKPKNSYDFAKDDISILHIGRFSEQKNHEMLLKSYKKVLIKHKNLKLNLIGDGEKREEIENIARTLDISRHISFLGLKSTVYDFLNEADIFILPSRWEGMPITIIEAMASALPIVATNVGGIPDMIKDNYSGLLVDVDEDRLAEALNELITKYDKREKFGRNAVKESEKFSSQRMANEYVKIYGTN